MKLTDTSDMDIVYIVRAGEVNEELRYSLRSLRNLPHRRVVIAGYIPKWVRNVVSIPVNQNQVTKYANAEQNWQHAMNDHRVSDNFILFNDDFFVMQPLAGLPNLHRGKLNDVIRYYEQINSGQYLQNMERTRDLLLEFGIEEPLSYALHVPMMMNKKRRKVLQATQLMFNESGLDIQMRTLYGNFYHLGGEYYDDVKANGLNDMPDKSAVFLSSNDQTFMRGKIGEYIKATFTEKSYYER